LNFELVEGGIMTTWEYLKTSGDGELEELGRRGWELVAVVPSESGGGAALYFKRPGLSFREQVTEDQKRRYYALKGLGGPGHQLEKSD
jgi:hypothetical protein